MTILLATAALYAGAQTAYDALTFSENNYEGTARSVAMGNAFTALGGDLGAININPAGSAVSNYSQMTITPGLTFSTNQTKGVPFGDGSLDYFEKEMTSRMTRFSLPNIAMNFNWDTGRKSGIKSMSFGFAVNKTAGWDEDVYANGTNSTTSFMGQMADEATIMGYRESDLYSENAYDYMPWNMAAGYQSGMISTFGGYDDLYIGASEQIFYNPSTGQDEIGLGGPLEQTYGRHVTGGKYDYMFNFGMNISDVIYIGANLGATSLEYDYSEYFREQAVDPYDFEIQFSDGTSTRFEQMRYNYLYRATGSGIYAKFGVILTPVAGLRIGAAIQTPTLHRIVEEWQISASTDFSDSRYSGKSSSPYGENRYDLKSPMTANFGIAYTFGTLGVLSMDYELCDYSGMRYGSNSYDKEYYDEVNDDIRTRFGIAHSLRAGLEIKPISSVALRAGYNLSTAAETTDSWGDRLPQAYTQNASFGLGYSSKKSFFMDFAVRKTFLAEEYYMPYPDYIFDSNGDILAPAPEIRINHSLWKVLLTFGWRF